MLQLVASEQEGHSGVCEVEEVSNKSNSLLSYEFYIIRNKNYSQSVYIFNLFFSIFKDAV